MSQTVDPSGESYVGALPDELVPLDLFSYRHQGYLERAPLGIDARKAWSKFPGSDGSGMCFAAVQNACYVDHQDFQPSPIIQTIYGNNLWVSGDTLLDPTAKWGAVLHGTAIFGIVCGKQNGKPLLGIAPRLEAAGLASKLEKVEKAPGVYIYVDGEGSAARAIRAAAEWLKNRGGGVLHVPLATPGRIEYVEGTSQRVRWTSAVPLEWKDIVHDAISEAVASGIHVVESACNGWGLEVLNTAGDWKGQSVAKFLASSAFDDTVKERVRTHLRGVDLDEYPAPKGDSGAVIVGSAVPVFEPAGPEHQRVRGWFRWDSKYREELGPPYTNTDIFGEGASNYGSRVQCYAWDLGIVTASGSLSQGTWCDPADPNLRATNYCMFAGTSGASAIVAGAMVSIVGALKAHGKDSEFGPAQLRELLAQAGSGTRHLGVTVGANGPVSITGEIGVMPDIHRILSGIVQPAPVL